MGGAPIQQPATSTASATTTAATAAAARTTTATTASAPTAATTATAQRSPLSARPRQERRRRRPARLLLLLLLLLLHPLDDLPLPELPAEVVRHHPLDLLHLPGAAVSGQRLAHLPLGDLQPELRLEVLLLRLPLRRRPRLDGRRLPRPLLGEGGVTPAVGVGLWRR